MWWQRLHQSLLHQTRRIRVILHSQGFLPLYLSLISLWGCRLFHQMHLWVLKQLCHQEKQFRSCQYHVRLKSHVFRSGNESLLKDYLINWWHVFNIGVLCLRGRNVMYYLWCSIVPCIITYVPCLVTVLHHCITLLYAYAHWHCEHMFPLDLQCLSECSVLWSCWFIMTTVTSCIHAWTSQMLLQFLDSIVALTVFTGGNTNDAWLYN